MDKQQAVNIIKNTFENPFDKNRFTIFVKNLLNSIEEAPFSYQGQFIPEAYRQYIRTLERIGKFNDGENRIDILVIRLHKETSLERARTMQRNFVAWYLNGSRGGELKDAALAAFVSPDEEDWRFSLVKMDYKFEQTKTGKTKVKEEFTPARRWSFLVGKNENSHTAQSRLVNILANDEHNPTLAELEQTFDIETVTKEFFIKYRELFIRTKEELDKVVEKDTKIKADFEAKGVNTVDFAKKLLGQITFLYFLQKKGWFGVGRDAEWGTGSKHFLRELFKKKHGDYKNFFNEILEPLFYEALRIDRSHDDDYYSRFNCKIPFLNGGLFDPIGNYDWVHTDIILLDSLFSNNNKTREGDEGDGILDIFDRYNFTVREDEPLEKEVAIDPELLGKAYEKFNAIRPDNFEEYKKALKSGNKGEESKFNKQYGVYYTPREIVHYMCQQSLINYLHTEVIASEAKQSPIPSKKDIETMIHIGEQVSENEEIALLKEQKILEGKQKSSDYKSILPESIRNNAGLIDRKLSDIAVCDPAVGSGAFPVGMMNEIVKIRMVLNSYLCNSHPSSRHSREGGNPECVNRTPYDFKRHCIEKSLYGVDIDPGAVEIAKLRLWLSLVVDEDDIKNIKPLPNLDYKIICGNSLLGVKKDLLNDHLFKELETLKPLYFNETNPTKKQEYKNRIDELIGKITNGHKEFDFEVYFSEVFHHKGGFDVVIANPPYKILTKNNTLSFELNYLLQNYSSIKKSYSKNLFTLFIERGINILSIHGVLSFIVPEGLFKTRSYAGCVGAIQNSGHVKSIATFTEYVFENAITGNLIFVFLKGEKGITENYHFDKNLEIGKADSKENRIVQKIQAFSFTKPLRDVATLFKGMVVKDRELFLSDNSKGKKNVFLLGKNISKWKLDSRFFTIYEDLKIIGGTKEKAKHDYYPRILIRRTGNALCCTLLEEPALTESTLYSCWSNTENISNKYLLALFNSRLLDYYVKTIMITNKQAFPQILMTDLEGLPMVVVDEKKQQPFITLVDQILTVKKKDPNADTSALERQIDKMVYKLYGLTPEEIEIVEGKGI